MSKPKIGRQVIVTYSGIHTNSFGAETFNRDTDRALSMKENAVIIPTIETDFDGVEWLCTRIVPLSAIKSIVEQTVTVKDDEESEDERL